MTKTQVKRSKVQGPPLWMQWMVLSYVLAAIVVVVVLTVMKHV